MSDGDVAILPGSAVREFLDGQEDLVLRAVEKAYLAHALGQTHAPVSQALHVNGGRFFALPGSIDDCDPIVGMKWVASFVSNVTVGSERASALLIVNDAATGRPVAVVDGTLISAKRTAAGAALALRVIADRDSVQSIGLVGCGPINYEILRFLAHLFPVTRVHLVDVDRRRVDAFAHRVQSRFGSIVPIASELGDMLEYTDAVSIATNATVPHINRLPARPLAVLHISLRDLAPEVIAGSYNIVDDVEHACTARTSLHLAAEAFGRRDFVRATIPGLLAGRERYEAPPAPTIVSPFGLSILDLSVLREVLVRARGAPGLTCVRDFCGSAWD